VSITVGTIVWNYTSPEGEKIPIAGWIVAGAMILVTLVIVFAYYYQRWKFISRWRFVTSTGLNCYFEKGACFYSEKMVEDDLDVALRKWVKYINKEDKTTPDHYILDGYFIDGAICIFRPEETFVHTSPGWWSRRVYGVAGWNWCMVGQGNKPIENTAFKHEVSHILYNNYVGDMVSEEESHRVFKEVGV